MEDHLIEISGGHYSKEGTTQICSTYRDFACNFKSGLEFNKIIGFVVDRMEENT